MERGTKRKAASLASSPATAPPTKRHKTPRQLPQYYQIIRLPVAVETIQEKVDNRKYSSVSEIEGDVKRMILNAKEFNEPGSGVHLDAERIRKMAFNFFKTNNPAYKKSRHYTAVATPRPGDSPPEATTTLRLTASSKKSPTTNSQKRKRDTSASVKPQKRSESAQLKPEPMEVDEAPLEEGFKGLSFQKAQEKIIQELIEYTDPDVPQPIFTPFHFLPNRSLRDYYLTIKNPTSLKGIMKKVEGKQPKNPTNVTEYKSWDAFEHEVARIWSNAREYNEDGTDMHFLADEFEEAFKKRLLAAKKVVEEPTQTKLKLNMGDSNKAGTSSSLKLKLGSQKPSPAPATNNSVAPTSASSANTKASNDVAPAATESRPQTANAARSTTSPAKSAKLPNGSPAPVSKSVQVNGVMPPPASSTKATTGGNVHSTMPPPQNLPPQAHFTPPAYHQPTNSFDSKWRPKPHVKQDGAVGEPDILMSKVHMVTHPDLAAAKPFKITVPADKVMSQQSVTATLNSSHPAVRLQAELAEPLKGPHARPYRLFVSNNGVRQSQRVVQPDYAHMSNGLVNGTYAAAAKEKEKGPSWDVRLHPGTNRIEVECVAAAKPGSGSNDLVMEQVSLFVFQMKTQ
ncbi:MAG: hypothetical protein Q9162_000624 [Coniocarpon cinnabarinum]